MSDHEHEPAPGRQPGIEERIAAAGPRIAALREGLALAQRQLAAALARVAPDAPTRGGQRA